MSEFRRINDVFFASPQITVADVDAARSQGISLIINNRPEGEDPGQTEGESIRAAAESAGLRYAAIPVTSGGFSEAQVEATIDALNTADGPVLAYCRSGTRSTLLWALAATKEGAAPDAVAQDAAAAGYDVSPIRGLLESLARHRSR